MSGTGTSVQCKVSDSATCGDYKFFLAQIEVTKCSTHVRVSRIRHVYLRWNGGFE